MECLGWAIPKIFLVVNHWPGKAPKYRLQQTISILNIKKKLVILPNSKSLHSHCTQHIGKEARKRRRQKQEQAKAKAAREARGRNKEDIGIVEPRLCSSNWLLLYSRGAPPPRHAAAASRTNELSSSRGLEAESRKELLALLHTFFVQQTDRDLSPSAKPTNERANPS